VGGEAWRSPWSQVSTRRQAGRVTIVATYVIKRLFMSNINIFSIYFNNYYRWGVVGNTFTIVGVVGIPTSTSNFSRMLGGGARRGTVNINNVCLISTVLLHT